MWLVLATSCRLQLTRRAFNVAAAEFRSACGTESCLALPLYLTSAGLGELSRLLLDVDSCWPAADSYFLLAAKALLLDIEVLLLVSLYLRIQSHFRPHEELSRLAFEDVARPRSASGSTHHSYRLCQALRAVDCRREL